MTDLFENLNPQQAQAVQHTEGPLLVFAGAGSGKTRVITHRVAFLVRDHHIPPWNILAVTFTNKAAGEMRSRVGGLIGEGLRDTWIGTFHATCSRLLRQYADQAKLKKDFVIYDDSDQKAMVTRCVRDLNLDEKRIPPRAIQSRINTAKQECISAEEYTPGDYFEDQVSKVYVQYEKRMAAAGAVDFGDLLYRMVRLLEENPKVTETLRRRFRYIMVDEFQDTNHVQYRLLKLLTGTERNICVVGDDDQSIYRWRGADVRNILGFRKDYPEALVVTLEQNYRSSGNILESAVAVIKRNRTRAPKTLWTENPQGELLELVTLTDEREEAGYVVREVSKALDAGLPPGDMAVFYRINAQARVIEEALRAGNVPYRIIGGMKFYERAEVKDLVAYLRVIFNIDNDVDLVRIINRPARKIGSTTVVRLMERATARGISCFSALSEALTDPEWPAATRKRLKEFHELITGLRELSPTMAPSELALNVLERTKYLEELQAQNTPEAESRIENLKELVGSFALFEKESDDPSLPALLESISLVQDVDSMDENAAKVTLMTVHSAKGLEFPTVFLTGMEEDIFPYQRVNEEVDELERQEQIEEERRLAYVAITRARKKLYLTNVARRRLFGNERYGMPSRFLDDIPGELTHATNASGRARPTGVSSVAMALVSSSRRSSRSSVKLTPDWAKGLLPARSEQGGSSPPRRTKKTDNAEAPATDLNEPIVTYDDNVDVDMELRPGMSVRHEKYGVGQVQAINPGFNPKVVVHFVGHGRKTIIAKYLQPA